MANPSPVQSALIQNVATPLIKGTSSRCGPLCKDIIQSDLNALHSALRTFEKAGLLPTDYSYLYKRSPYLLLIIKEVSHIQGFTRPRLITCSFIIIDGNLDIYQMTRLKIGKRWNHVTRNFQKH